MSAGAAHQRNYQHRQHPEHADQTQRDRIMRELEDVPVDRNAAHLRTRRRHELAQPQ